jgi:hypothetical protein
MEQIHFDGIGAVKNVGKRSLRLVEIQGSLISSNLSSKGYEYNFFF